jgi:peptidoglycan hydrolase-like protein with peptidoglycan-binding domain
MMQGICLFALVLSVLSCDGGNEGYSKDSALRADWRRSSDLVSARRSNPDDMVMQVRLQGLGYNPGPIDGVVGPSTRAALQRYQMDHGLLASGLPGPATRARLLPVSAHLTGGYPTGRYYRRISGRTLPAPRYPGDIAPLVGADDGYGLTPAGRRRDNFYRILRPEDGRNRQKDDPKH